MNSKTLILSRFWPNFLILLRLSSLLKVGAFQAQLLSNPMPKFRKNRSNSKKMSGWTDTWILFYKALPATTGGSTEKCALLLETTL